MTSGSLIHTPESEILIVEDTPKTVEGLTAELEYRGANVHGASTRRYASAVIEDSLLNAIIVDLNIPNSPGVAPSPEVGRRLVEDICEGRLGDLNRHTPILIITAQQSDDRPSDLHYDNYLGIVSKIGSSGWIVKKLVDAGVCEARSELDLDLVEPQRERIQVVIESITDDRATVAVPDLMEDSITVRTTQFTPSIRRLLQSSRLPLTMWAVGNVVAETPEDLQLKEFEVSNEQVRKGRDYLDIDWLRSPGRAGYQRD
ncbi:hypothetical protein [Antrihabitans spumae]|uniref:Response regulatory domain-containing protein n=1 Tax=Antrihabitans spumae TaxID=3373370 RepID=A0ABW7KQQ4_9NOCA